MGWGHEWNRSVLALKMLAGTEGGEQFQSSAKAVTDARQAADDARKNYVDALDDWYTSGGAKGVGSELHSGPSARPTGKWEYEGNRLKNVLYDTQHKEFSKWIRNLCREDGAPKNVCELASEAVDKRKEFYDLNAQHEKLRQEHGIVLDEAQALNEISVSRIEDAVANKAPTNKAGPVGPAQSAGLKTQAGSVAQQKRNQVATQNARAAWADKEKLTGGTPVYGQQQRFKQQCYLLSRMKQFSSFSAQLHKGYVVDKIDYSRKLPYADDATNTMIPVYGAPFGMVNKLIGSTNYHLLNELTTMQISALVPFVRIFKVFKQKDGSEIHNEIIFNTHLTADDLAAYDKRDSRGYGAGLESFDITFDGSNFFTAKKAIKAKLSMHFDSFNEILKTRKGSAASFRYVDLALRTSGKKDPNRDSFPENYRIKVVMGWAVPTTGLDPMIFPKAEQNKAIKNSCISLNLVMVDHNFDIDDIGRVTFDIDYMAYVDAAFSTKYANVLTNAELMKRYLGRERDLKIVSTLDCANEDKDQVREMLESERDKDKKIALKTLLIKLGADKKIFYHVIPVKQLDSFNNKGPWSDFGTMGLTDSKNFKTKDVKKDILKIIDAYDDDKDLPENLTGLIAKPTSRDEYVLPFVFLGDILNAGLANISEFTSKSSEVKSGDESVDDDFLVFSKSFQDLRILLGDIELVEPKTGQIFRCNMADVPISIDYFVEWFTAKVISKGGEAEYPLVNFVKDLMNSVLSVASSEDCFGSSMKSKVHSHVSYLSGMPNKVDGQDNVTKLASMDDVYGRLGIDPTTYLTHMAMLGTPIIQVADDVHKMTADTGKQYKYVIFYVTRAYPHDHTGDYAIDAQVGIPHFEIGRAEGLVKNIQFKKTEQPYYKELRYEQEGYAGLSQIRDPYDATITLFGNATYFPGMYVYVDPRGLGPAMGSPSDDTGGAGYGSFSWQLGIGGYYMIYKCGSRVSSGVFETTLYARWVGRGGKKDPELAPAVMPGVSENCGSEAGPIFNTSKQGKNTGTPMVIAERAGGGHYGYHVHEKGGLFGAKALDYIAKHDAIARKYGGRFFPAVSSLNGVGGGAIYVPKGTELTGDIAKEALGGGFVLEPGTGESYVQYGKVPDAEFKLWFGNVRPGGQ